MHILSYALKRAHWAAEKLGRTLLTQVGLTAARFEYMFAIAHTGFPRDLDRCIREERQWRLREPPAPTTQARLYKELGLTRASIGQMLGVLEGMGWIRRGPLRPPPPEDIFEASQTPTQDRRTRLVWLTELGLEILMKALAERLGPRVMGPRFERAVATPGADWREQRREEAGVTTDRIRDLHGTIAEVGIRVGFGAYWRLMYPLDDCSRKTPPPGWPDRVAARRPATKASSPS